MKLTKRQLKRIIREEKQRLQELDFSGPAVGTDADVYGKRIKPPRSKSEAEDLLHDALLSVEKYLSLQEIEDILAMLYG